MSLSRTWAPGPSEAGALPSPLHPPRPALHVSSAALGTSEGWDQAEQEAGGQAGGGSAAGQAGSISVRSLPPAAGHDRGTVQPENPRPLLRQAEKEGAVALVPRRIEVVDAVEWANEASCIRLAAMSLDGRVDTIKSEFVR